MPRLLLYRSPPPCCPVLLILHKPPAPFVVLADCYIQIEKPPARVRRHPTRANVPPGRARRRLAWARIFVPGLVAAGARVAPSCPGAWRRHN